MPNNAAPRPVHESLKEYGRGIAGGLLFSLPLLYTAEIWSTGFRAEAWRLLVYLVITFILLLGYNRYAGMRRDADFLEVMIDSVEELGLGLLVSAGVLYLLGRLDPQIPITELIGMIVVESFTVAIGISVGGAQLGEGHEESGERDAPETNEQSTGKRGQGSHHLGGELVLAMCGSVLVAANIAATDEVEMIATEASLWKIIGMALLSILLAALILFYLEFRGSARRWGREGKLIALRGTLEAYATALVASALLLWVYRSYDGTTLTVTVAQTVVVALPAVLGASAGRILIS